MLVQFNLNEEIGKMFDLMQVGVQADFLWMDVLWYIQESEEWLLELLEILEDDRLLVDIQIHQQYSSIELVGHLVLYIVKILEHFYHHIQTLELIYHLLFQRNIDKILLVLYLVIVEGLEQLDLLIVYRLIQLQ